MYFADHRVYHNDQLSNNELQQLSNKKIILFRYRVPNSVYCLLLLAVHSISKPCFQSQRTVATKLRDR